MNSVINWFEIPASDFERAVEFYEKVFSTKLKREIMNGISEAVFPRENPGPSGSVVKKENLNPGINGTRIYLEAGGDMAALLSRVERAGGKIVLNKTLIREDIGHIGIFMDCEGNQIGVHSGCKN